MVDLLKEYGVPTAPQACARLKASLSVLLGESNYRAHVLKVEPFVAQPIPLSGELLEAELKHQARAAMIRHNAHRFKGTPSAPFDIEAVRERLQHPLPRISVLFASVGSFAFVYKKLLAANAFADLIKPSQNPHPGLVRQWCERQSCAQVELLHRDFNTKKEVAIDTIKDLSGIRV